MSDETTPLRKDVVGGEAAKVSAMRPLGSAEGREDQAASPPPAPEELRAAARAALETQFVDALVLKAKLVDEGGRDPEAAQHKMRVLVGSLEGANRLALKLGLIDVPTSKQLFADAMKRGLYEGWR